MAFDMRNTEALNMTCNMALHQTANGVTYQEPPVLSNGKWRLPPFLLDYFTEMTPDGNFKEDMDFYFFERITNDGWILTKTWGLPSTSCYFPKFVKFVMDGNWNSKHLKDIPGIGEVYAARMKTSLKGYCSACEDRRPTSPFKRDRVRVRRYVQIGIKMHSPGLLIMKAVY